MPKAPDMREFDALKPANSCPITRLEISDEKRASLNEAMRRPNEYSATIILGVIRGWGFRVSEKSVLRHRSGACRCAR